MTNKGFNGMKKITYYDPFTGVRISKRTAIKGAIESGRLLFEETVTLSDLKKYFPEEYKKLVPNTLGVQ